MDNKIAVSTALGNNSPHPRWNVRDLLAAIESRSREAFGRAIRQHFKAGTTSIPLRWWVHCHEQLSPEIELVNCLYLKKVGSQLLAHADEHFDSSECIEHNELDILRAMDLPPPLQLELRRILKLKLKVDTQLDTAFAYLCRMMVDKGMDRLPFFDVVENDAGFACILEMDASSDDVRIVAMRQKDGIYEFETDSGEFVPWKHLDLSGRFYVLQELEILLNPEMDLTSVIW